MPRRAPRWKAPFMRPPISKLSEITVSISGSYLILEGFVRLSGGDVERAIEIAEGVVGRGYVRGRLLRR